MTAVTGVTDENKTFLEPLCVSIFIPRNLFTFYLSHPSQISIMLIKTQCYMMTDAILFLSFICHSCHCFGVHGLFLAIFFLCQATLRQGAETHSWVAFQLPIIGDASLIIDFR